MWIDLDLHAARLGWVHEVVFWTEAMIIDPQGISDAVARVLERANDSIVIA